MKPKSLSGKEPAKAKAFGDAICLVWDNNNNNNNLNLFKASNNKQTGQSYVCVKGLKHIEMWIKIKGRACSSSKFNNRPCINCKFFLFKYQYH